MNSLRKADGKHTVLVVDDDKQVLDGMAVLLTSWGYAVIAARSLEQASRELDKAIPQLIVTDFRLATETTGIDVVHAVRKAIGFDVPAIIITGDTSPQGISEANASGFTVLTQTARHHNTERCDVKCYPASCAKHLCLLTINRGENADDFLGCRFVTPSKASPCSSPPTGLSPPLPPAPR
ncbi:response regulator [Achromobacter insuavis]